MRCWAAWRGSAWRMSKEDWRAISIFNGCFGFRDSRLDIFLSEFRFCSRLLCQEVKPRKINLVFTRLSVGKAPPQVAGLSHGVSFRPNCFWVFYSGRNWWAVGRDFSKQLAIDLWQWAELPDLEYRWRKASHIGLVSSLTSKIWFWQVAFARISTELITLRWSFNWFICGYIVFANS